MRDGWTETTLGEVVNIQKGKKPPAIDAYEEFSRPYLTADVLRGAPCEQFVSGALVGSCVQLSGHESVLLWDGAGAGDVFRSQPGILASTMAKVESKNFSSIDNGYLYLYLDTKRIEIKSSCRGTTVPHVSPEALKSLNFSLPPLVAQKRIVDVVSSVDDYIDALQKQADSARAARNAVLSGLINDSQGIEYILNDVVKIDARLVDPTDEPYLNMLHIGVDKIQSCTGQILNPSTAAHDAVTSGKYLFSSDDVLFSKIRPELRKACFPGYSGLSSAEVYPLTCTSKVLPNFLLFTLLSDEFSREVISKSGRTKMPKVNRSELLSTKIVLPNLVEQKRIVEIVSSMDEVVQSSEQAFIDAKNLRSGLLSDLLSGNHEIPASYDSLLGAA